MKPENTNFLQPTKYVLTFPEIPDTTYFCQKANIPGVQLGMAEQQTPNLDLYHSGTKMTYNTFDITFLVNESLTAWTTIYNWMVELSSMEATYNKRKENKKQVKRTKGEGRKSRNESKGKTCKEGKKRQRDERKGKGEE